LTADRRRPVGRCYPSTDASPPLPAAVDVLPNLDWARRPNRGKYPFEPIEVIGDLLFGVGDTFGDSPVYGEDEQPQAQAACCAPTEKPRQAAACC
jgi:hypothetical protein